MQATSHKRQAAFPSRRATTEASCWQASVVRPPGRIRVNKNRSRQLSASAGWQSESYNSWQPNKKKIRIYLPYLKKLQAASHEL